MVDECANCEACDYCDRMAKLTEDTGIIAFENCESLRASWKRIKEKGEMK